jgi:hypothetical protein
MPKKLKDDGQNIASYGNYGLTFAQGPHSLWAQVLLHTLVISIVVVGSKGLGASDIQ